MTCLGAEVLLEGEGDGGDVLARPEGLEQRVAEPHHQ
jgi:hypothetical protein